MKINILIIIPNKATNINREKYRKIKKKIKELKQGQRQIQKILTTNRQELELKTVTERQNSFTTHLQNLERG